MWLGNFLKVKSGDVVTSVTSAIANADPEAAGKADLLTMEQDLDKTGTLVMKIRSDLAKESAELDGITKKYNELMDVADELNRQISAPDVTPEKKSSLEKSLETLLNQIQSVVPGLDQHKKDVASIQSLLADANAAYQKKATDLKNAKSVLEEAKHDLTRAQIEQERAADRANQAAELAGLRGSTGSRIAIATEALKQSAEKARTSAGVENMKAEALKTVDTATEDPNIAAAMQKVTATEPTQSLTDRLAALRRN